MNNEKIAKINSKFILNEIFSFCKYEHALKIMKYNKALQIKLNITLNDYAIDCRFAKRLEVREYDENIITKITNDNSFLLNMIPFFQFIFLIVSLINIKYWKKNFYNIYLIVDLIYKIMIIIYLLTGDKCDLKNEGNLACYYFVDIVLNLFLLAILINKIISDINDINDKKILLILNSIMISVCFIIIILICINFYFFLKKCQKTESGIIKKTKKEEKNIAIINKFRGFNIDTYEYSSLNTYGVITSEEIDLLLKLYLNYTITDSQADLINLINKLRKKKNIKELNYTNTEKLYDFFIRVKRFYALDNINKINNNIYLFIYPRNKFKSLVLENDEKIMKILYKNFFDHILILEKNNNEYILIYSSNNNMIVNENNESFESTDRKDLLKLRKNY